jgi:hypothetical protein
LSVKFTRLIAILFVLVAIPISAVAGGWAMSSFDELPTSFESGETYALSYTILQHGKTPVDVGESSIIVTDPAGRTTVFEATKTKEPGRYTVEVTFPEAGTFKWQVSQGMFEPHDLGTIGVAEGAASAVAGSSSRPILTAAFALVVALLGLQIYSLWRKRPQAIRAD